jgi:hypothetical protein
MICGKCGREKIWRGNRWRCRTCQIAAQKRCYLKNRTLEISKRRERADRIRAIQYAKIAEIKNVPCADCGHKFPHYVMEFDHIEDKSYNVASMVGFNWEKVLTEIKKCEVVCSNCHAIRTWNRLHH